MNWQHAAMICAAIVAMAAFAACSSGDEREDDSEPVVASCDGIRQIDSYRYGVSLKMEPAPGTPVPSPADGSPPPLSAFADALSTLFSDFTLEGAYRSPDRSQAILRFQEEELELRSIGDEAWVRVGMQWQESTTSEQELLTPLVVCEEIVLRIAPSLRQTQGEEDTVHGIAANHYKATEDAIGDLSEILGDRLPDDYNVEVWLAQEGRWPLQMRIASTGNSRDNGAFELSMYIRDINDAGIKIDPPVIAPPAR